MLTLTLGADQQKLLRAVAEAQQCMNGNREDGGIPIPTIRIKLDNLEGKNTSLQIDTARQRNTEVTDQLTALAAFWVSEGLDEIFVIEGERKLLYIMDESGFTELVDMYGFKAVASVNRSNNYVRRVSTPPQWHNKSKPSATEMTISAANIVEHRGNYDQYLRTLTTEELHKLIQDTSRQLCDRLTEQIRLHKDMIKTLRREIKILERTMENSHE